jgi:serine O-acetyltransferase
MVLSDYRAMVELRPEEEGGLRSLLRAPARLLLQPQMRAQILFRLSAAAPWWLWWLPRALLVTLYSCEVMPGARIGPRLRLPHPFGIMIAGEVVVGSDVSLAHNVTLGADRMDGGQPRIGDRVTVLPGAVVAGSITVGDDALVGANSVLLEDLPAGGRCAPPETRTWVPE